MIEFPAGLAIGYIARHYIHPDTLKDWARRAWLWINGWFGR